MRIIFMGTPEFAVPSLDMLVKEGYDIAAVVTQPDKPKGRGNKLASPPVKDYAVENCIPVLQPDRVKTPEFAAKLEALHPDLLVTAAYGRILPKEILDIPPMGCINVHASLLPKYRGAAPINWAVINGDKETGVTTMFMDIGMDTGDILLKSKIEIADDLTAGELHDRLMVMGAGVLKETVEKLIEGTLERTPQSNEEATHAPMLQKDLGLIDWSKSTREIHNLIRGTNPWPGAYTFYKGERIKIWKSQMIDSCIVHEYQGTSVRAVPGTICRITGEKMSVLTGDGLLDIFEVQFDCCRKMGIHECGHNIDEGEILG